jgi:hypothetical protein
MEQKEKYTLMVSVECFCQRDGRFKGVTGTSKGKAIRQANEF